MRYVEKFKNWLRQNEPENKIKILKGFARGETFCGCRNGGNWF